MVLYIITFPNSKKYIGITNNIIRRKYQHKTYSKTQTTRLYNAIKKYGWENLIWKIIPMKNEKIAASKEIEYIKKYKTQNKLYGYNLNPGGDISRLGCKHTDETKKKIGLNSKSRVQGKNNPFYGKKHSIKTKKLISKNRKGKNAGINNHNFGKKASIASRLANRYAHSKFNENDIKNIKMKHTEGMTQTNIAKEYNVSLSTINRIVHNKVWYEM